MDRIELARALVECRRAEARKRQIYERANYLVSKFGDKTEHEFPYYQNHDFADYADGNVLVIHHIIPSERLNVSWGTHLVFRTIKGEITVYKPYTSWIRALNELTKDEFELPKPESWEDVPEEFPHLFRDWAMEVRLALYPSEMRKQI